MESRTVELERFKIEINLPRFAADAFGYVQVKRKSSANSSFMFCESTGSKVAIQKDTDRHWTYWSITDASDQGGSIIDFVKHRTGENLGHIRKRLRPYLNSPSLLSSRPQLRDIPLDLKPIGRDVLGLRKQFARECTPLKSGLHRYLQNDRFLEAAKLNQPPFRNALFVDKRNNVVAPHYDHSGLTGWELRNANFKGFSPKGYKSLWFAGPGREERKSLVLAEAMLDAVSYGILHPDKQACYLSVGGSLSPSQRQLLEDAFRKLPQLGAVIIAADNDQAGGVFAQDCFEILQQSGRSDLQFRTHSPEHLKDWNDVLKEKANSIGSDPNPG